MAKASNDDETMAEAAARLIQADILAGLLAPGRKLSMEWLKSHYRLGSSPLREALSRLAMVGLVTVESHRGFRVAAISQEDLADITLVRRAIETTALGRAIALGDTEWEVNVIAAFARLELAVSRRRKADDPARVEIEEAHKRFHASLVAASGSPRLIQLSGLFYDQARRYRDLMVKALRNLDEFLEEHRVLMKLVLGRNVEAASAQLAAHLELTPAAVYPEVRSAGKAAARGRRHGAPPATSARPGAER